MCYEIENLRDGAVTVLVRDHIPLSRHEQISVRLDGRTRNRSLARRYGPADLGGRRAREGQTRDPVCSQACPLYVGHRSAELSKTSEV